MADREVSDDGLDEDAWCKAQREIVVEYLGRTGVRCGEISPWPAWYIAPLVGVWAVESASKAGWVGWWAISGDVPCDYEPCGPARHPREGLGDIARRWQHAAAKWERGERDDLIEIGDSTDEVELAPLLVARADMLLEWCADDSLWQGC